MDEKSGTHDHPRSALNLRLFLASFGLVVCAALAILSAWAGITALAVSLAVLAAVAVVDIVVLGIRIARRRRGGEQHTLFE
ncbi:hypothetical protein GCM10022252_53830 [Streptosporangium oxazolinicum]|uniref:Uncharacterized protein n=1 Tax=Streptosporangium oxazolinicum TaxID=909287 RepID=A0ABP8B8H4_9ACTN